MIPMFSLFRSVRSKRKKRPNNDIIGGLNENFSDKNNCLLEVVSAIVFLGYDECHLILSILSIGKGSGLSFLPDPLSFSDTTGQRIRSIIFLMVSRSLLSVESSIMSSSIDIISSCPL